MLQDADNWMQNPDGYLCGRPPHTILIIDAVCQLHEFCSKFSSSVGPEFNRIAVVFVASDNVNRFLFDPHPNFAVFELEYILHLLVHFSPLFLVILMGHGPPRC